MTPNKVCPVVMRCKDGFAEILAFRHPRAGFQLIKGTIEPGEAPEIAALRELAEESGIKDVAVSRELGLWPSGHEGQVWWMAVIEPAASLPDTWSHHAPDDGGMELFFFWQPLHLSLDPGWHPVFRRAITFVSSFRSGNEWLSKPLL